MERIREDPREKWPALCVRQREHHPGLATRRNRRSARGRNETQVDYRRCGFRNLFECGGNGDYCRRFINPKIVARGLKSSGESDQCSILNAQFSSERKEASLPLG